MNEFTKRRKTFEAFYNRRARLIQKIDAKANELAFLIALYLLRT